MVSKVVSKAPATAAEIAEELAKSLKASIARRGGLGSGRGPTSVRLGIQNSQKKTSRVTPASLPGKWEKTPDEEDAKKKRWARFAGWMSKPYNYTSFYAKDLQALDSKGCINLKRLTRQDWPLSTDTANIALIFFCPYEGLEGELSIAQNGINIVDDAALVADTFLRRGFRVVYFQDATASEFTAWFDYFLEDVLKTIVVYFIGYGKKVLDENGDAGTCLLLYNHTRKKGSKPPPAVTGVTDHTVSEDFLYNNIAGVDYPEKSITFYFDLYQSAAVFQSTPPEEAAALAKLTSSHSTPPSNTVIIQSLVDVDALLKQNGTATKGKAAKTGAVVDHSSGLARQLAEQPIEKGFFSSIMSFVNTLIDTFTGSSSSGSSGGGGGGGSSSSSGGGSTSTSSGGGSSYTYTSPTTTVTTSVPPAINPSKPNTQPIPSHQTEQNINQSIQTLNNQGTPVSSITSLPPPTVSAAEKAGAEQRWKTFTAEMTKPATYTTKYKKELAELDKMGAINLDRVTRSQIPDIQIDRAVALFFNPYEGLAHTLDAGPINDGITMATLLSSRGYKVLYLCDGTPKEYYIWMDWLLDNIYYEIVCYFSGHGTQCRDTTGKEADGLSELMVFYDESKKKESQAKKIKAVTGLTENTVSDDLMHELIISKQYPETRIILISDCCHSGTMFDFDQPIPANLERNKPPLNVVCIGAAKDEQTAKQTVLGGKESGVFTYNFSELLKKNKNTTFTELNTYMASKIAKYQDVHITTTHQALLSKPILVDAGK